MPHKVLSWFFSPLAQLCPPKALFLPELRELQPRAGLGLNIRAGWLIKISFWLRGPGGGGVFCVLLRCPGSSRGFSVPGIRSIKEPEKLWGLGGHLRCWPGVEFASPKEPGRNSCSPLGWNRIREWNHGISWAGRNPQGAVTPMELRGKAGLSWDSKPPRTAHSKPQSLFLGISSRCPT